MPNKLSLVLALTCSLLLFVVQPVLADGIVIIEPPPPPDEPAYLSVKYHRVTVDIEDQVATTHVDQVFVNDSRDELEGVYLFPLPDGAAIDDFAMWVDGERLSGKLLPADEARDIYEDIVRSQRDPALLEYAGRNTFRARIFPIPPKSEKRVEIEYREVLSLDRGLIHYRYPLDTERFSPRPIEDVSIRVEVQSREAIKAVYSPSHEIEVDRPDEGSGRDYHFVAGYEDVDVRPDTDFDLYYTVAQEDIGLNLLSYKTDDKDGFFLMLLAPQVEVEQAEIVAKDVILVLDTSGSMRGEKLAQAKKALSFVLDQLYDEDRFNVVSFSTGVRTFQRLPLEATTRARADALRWVDELEAKGGTNIHRALLDALSQLSSPSLGAERPAIVIFLTDGLATEGIVRSDDILDDVGDVAPATARLFTFGVGDDVHTVLLDRLARDHRGASAYVRPGQRIDETVSSFYAKVSTPLLSDLKLDLNGIHVEDTYPYPLPDLFAGTQIVMVGRYREGGSTTITLRGTVNGTKRVYEFGDARFREDGGESFIPRLWATRKVGYLLNQIRLHGESRELVQEIVDLAVRYGIMTPYTSFLVEEDVEVFSPEGRQRTGDRQYSDMAAEAPAAPSGKAAVDEAEQQMALERSDRAAGATDEAIQVIGDKAFVLREGVWTDTTFDTERMRPLKVSFMSSDYFRLASARPEWGAYLSVGERVLVVLPGPDGPTAYLVVEPDQGGPIDVPAPEPTSTPAAIESPAATDTPPSPPVTPTLTSIPARPVRQSTPLCRGAAAALLVALIALLPLAWRR